MVKGAYSRLGDWDDRNLTELQKNPSAVCCMRGGTACGLSAGWGAALLQRLGLTQPEQEMVWERRKSSSLFLPLKGLLRSWSQTLSQQHTEKGR